MEVTLEDGSTLTLEGCTFGKKPENQVVSLCITSDVGHIPLATTQDVSQLPWQSVQFTVDTHAAWSGSVGDVIPGGFGVAWRDVYRVNRGSIGFCRFKGDVSAQNPRTYIFWVSFIESVTYLASSVDSVIAEVGCQSPDGRFIGTYGLVAPPVLIPEGLEPSPVPVYIIPYGGDVTVRLYLATTSGNTSDSFLIEYACGTAPRPAPVHATGTFTAWDYNGNLIDQVDVELDLYLLKPSATVRGSLGQASG